MREKDNIPNPYRVFLYEILNIIESVVPLGWQEEWDNSGLQVGNRKAEIKAVLLTVDVTESVVAEAIDLGCNLIISHHPLIFKGIKHLTGDTPQERCILTAIQHGIAIYSAHTSVDNYLHGVSGMLAQKVGLLSYRPLSAHAQYPQQGLGVIGDLPEAIAFVDLLSQLKSSLSIQQLRYTEPAHPMVQRIALCGGSGSSLIGEAMSQGADVYVTADCKYHDMQLSLGQMAIVDIDHWVSEQFVRDVFADMLQEHVPVYIAKQDHTHIHIF